MQCQPLLLTLSYGSIILFMYNYPWLWNPWEVEGLAEIKVVCVRRRKSNRYFTSAKIYSKQKQNRSIVWLFYGPDLNVSLHSFIPWKCNLKDLIPDLLDCREYIFTPWIHFFKCFLIFHAALQLLITILCPLSNTGAHPRRVKETLSSAAIKSPLMVLLYAIKNMDIQRNFAW